MTLKASVGSLTAIGVLLAGCYSLQSTRGTPAVGTKVAFDVTDAGRVALGGALGPEIAQVEGQLVSMDSAGYLLSISNVRLLRGGEQVWSGEEVRVRRDYIGSAYERRFSLGRSIGFGVVGIGGFAAFMAGRSLIASGTRDNTPPIDTSNTRLGRP